jgi:Bacteriophage clamp loader A subunit
MSKQSPYVFINSINGNKVEPYSSDYVPYITARTMSYFQDTLVYAQLINDYQVKDPEMHYQLFISAVRPRKRFAKWGKPVTDPELKMISDYFQINTDRARELKQFMTADQIKQIADDLKSVC